MNEVLRKQLEAANERMQNTNMTNSAVGEYGGISPGIGQLGPYIAPRIARDAPEQPKPSILERLGWIEERLNNNENVTRKIFEELFDRLNKLETMVRG